MSDRIGVLFRRDDYSVASLPNLLGDREAWLRAKEHYAATPSGSDYSELEKKYHGDLDTAVVNSKTRSEMGNSVRKLAKDFSKHVKSMVSERLIGLPELAKQLGTPHGKRASRALESHAKWLAKTITSELASSHVSHTDEAMYDVGSELTGPKSGTGRSDYRKALALGGLAAHRQRSVANAMEDYLDPDNHDHVSDLADELDGNHDLAARYLRAARDHVSSQLGHYTGQSPDAEKVSYAVQTGTFQHVRKDLPRSTVPILSGHEPVSITGTGPKGKISATDVGKYLDRRSLNHGGELSLSSDEHKHHIAESLAHEAMHAMSQDNSAIGWYAANLRDAMRNVSRLHPEISTSKPKQSLFKAILAVTSNGSDVDKNFENAHKLYSAYKKYGRVLTESGLAKSNTTHGVQRWRFLRTTGPSITRTTWTNCGITPRSRRTLTVTWSDSGSSANG